MNALMALFDSDLRDEVFMLLEMTDIKNYTQFIGLNGSSASGKKEGTVAWPGSNEILLLILNNDEKLRFKEAVNDYKEQRQTPPGLLLFDWPLSEVV